MFKFTYSETNCLIFLSSIQSIIEFILILSQSESIISWIYQIVLYLFSSHNVVISLDNLTHSEKTSFKVFNSGTDIFLVKKSIEVQRIVLLASNDLDSINHWIYLLNIVLCTLVSKDFLYFKSLSIAEILFSIIDISSSIANVDTSSLIFFL